MSAPMRNVQPTQADADRLARAWDWVLRLRQDEPGQEELAQWLAWYESDDLNRQAFDEAQAFCKAAPGALESFEPARLPVQVAPARHVRRRRYAWLGAALAAGLAVLALLPALTPKPAPDRDIDTSLITAGPATQALVREAWLPDGSRVELAAQSSVALQYSEDARLLSMRDGVAYFTVAHNTARPFIVRAGGFYVRAVGTAFNVRTVGERVVVTVAEGTVDIYPAADERPAIAAPPDSVRIKAGKELVWDDARAQPLVNAADPAHALAWREGRLEYLNEPLSSVVADLNRYSPQHVVIADAAVGGIVFSGSVLTRSTGAWVRALPTLFPIDMKTDAAGNIVLSSRKG